MFNDWYAIPENQKIQKLESDDPSLFRFILNTERFTSYLFNITSKN